MEPDWRTAVLDQLGVLLRRTVSPCRASVEARKSRLAEATVLRLVQEATGSPAEALRARASEAAAQHALLVELLGAGHGPRFEEVAPAIRAALARMEKDT